jgi:hypothetical protein
MNLDNLFPDTSLPTSTIEDQFLDELKGIGGWAILNASLSLSHAMMEKMINNGYVATFQYGDDVYAYLPEACPIHTYVFKLPILDVIEEVSTGIRRPKDKAEEQKRNYNRRFISLWIAKKTMIEDHIMAYYLCLYMIGTHCIVSVPSFLLDKFEYDTKKAGITWTKVTPDVRIIRCSYCGERFNTYSKDQTFQCPECGEFTIPA